MLNFNSQNLILPSSSLWCHPTWPSFSRQSKQVFQVSLRPYRDFLSWFPPVNISCEVQPSVLASASGNTVWCWLGWVQDLERRKDAATTHWGDASLLRAGVFQEILAGTCGAIQTNHGAVIFIQIRPLKLHSVLKKRDMNGPHRSCRQGSYSLLTLISSCNGHSTSLRQRQHLFYNETWNARSCAFPGGLHLLSSKYWCLIYLCSLLWWVKPQSFLQFHQNHCK